jgi:hypothetical protein
MRCVLLRRFFIATHQSTVQANTRIRTDQASRDVQSIESITIGRPKSLLAKYPSFKYLQRDSRVGIYVPVEDGRLVRMR